RRGAGAAVGAGDVHDVGKTLHNTCRDRAHTDFRDELHRHGCSRIDLLQVEDELREVFDRVDVVVRRRRDQRDAGLRVTKARDLLGHFVAGELAALTGLGALRDLDLELVREGAVLRGNAEASRRDLFYRRVLLGVV